MIDDQSGGFVGFASKEDALLWQRVKRLQRNLHPITGMPMNPSWRNNMHICAGMLEKILGE